MSELPLWWVGNRNPSITEQITVNGVGVDLTTATVQFRLRSLGSSTLKVDQPASFKDATGNVRYDWGATDLDTAGRYLAWWQVTVGGKTQDMAEAVIEVRAHTSSRVYVELEAFKATLEMTGFSHADQDALLALESASRIVDNKCGRRFYPDTDALQVRYYTPFLEREIWIDDLITLTSLKTAPSSNRVFSETWAAADYLLAPVNAGDESRPFTSIKLSPASNFSWPYFSYPDSIEVTGRFGWLTVPAEVQTATSLVALQLMKRVREAPFGIIGGFEGDAIRIGRFDPQLDSLLADYKRMRFAIA